MQNQEISSAVLEMRVLATYIAKTIRSDLDRRLTEGNTGLSSLQFLVMRLLAYKTFTIKELSRMLALEPATLVPVVDTLERQELLRRERDPQDRRRTPLFLTERGRDILSQIPVVSPQDTLFTGLEKLGPVKAGQLLTLLHELVDYTVDDTGELSEALKAVQLQATPHS